MATYVGYTRVDAREHRWSDVAGSAVVSAAASWWLVDPAHPDKVAVLPFVDHHRFGLQLAARW